MNNPEQPIFRQSVKEDQEDWAWRERKQNALVEREREEEFAYKEHTAFRLN